MQRAAERQSVHPRRLSVAEGRAAEERRRHLFRCRMDSGYQHRNRGVLDTTYRGLLLGWSTQHCDGVEPSFPGEGARSMLHGRGRGGRKEERNMEPGIHALGHPRSVPANKGTMRPRLRH